MSSREDNIYSAEFSATEQTLIDKEFHRLADNTYLDHAGTTLYADSQITSAAQQLQRDVICNPHTCRATGDYVDQVRYKILQFFNTNAEDYHVVFTANATAALRLVAEHFAFGEDSPGSFNYCRENHTSVLGMRELVKTPNIYTLSAKELAKNDEEKGKPPPIEGTTNDATRSLVVFSAQCNFSGYKMPLSIIENIQQCGLAVPGSRVKGNGNGNEISDGNYYVCLDAASFVATNYLDLQRYRSDYVCVSFYKIFGYPTGVGALLVSRRRGEAALRKRFYGGGTIKYAYAHTMEHELRDAFHERFEDGTLPFLSIVELLQGFRTLERLVPPSSGTGTMERISRHVHSLARYCERELLSMCHANGAPLVKCYNHTGYTNRQTQGGIVAFNVLTDAGSYVGFGEIACVAALHRILLRTGCFCNIGACQEHLGLTEDAMDAIYKRAGRVCGDYYDMLDGQPTGAVRVSFGYMTRVQDVQRLLQMLRASYVASKPLQRVRFIESQVNQLPKVLQHRAQRMRPRVLEVAIYPVKSCAALKLKSPGLLTSQGLQYDRQWMVVDMNGMAVTQKKCPQLCRLKPQIVGDQLQLRFDGNGDDGGNVAYVPLSMAESELCVSKVCRQPVEGHDCGDSVAQWISQQLDVEGLRLLRQSDAGSPRLSLVNQAQFLLVNCASVRSLQFEEPLAETVDRFRANIVVDTGIPFEELEYTRLRIGNVAFQVDGPCQRCDMICINQRTGERSPETLTTIARMQQGKMKFGIYISRDSDVPGDGDDHLYLAAGDILEID